MGIAVVATAGGIVPAYGAVMAAIYGVASSSATVTILSFAFVGSSVALASAGLAALGSSSSVDDFTDQGNWGTIVSVAGSGAYGAIGGYLSWNEQMKGLDHSFATERRRYWKAQSKNINSNFYGNSRSMKGLTPSNYVLHHPYGRTRSKIGMYYPVMRQEHAAIHAQYGYGNGNGGYWQYYPFNNWWWFLRCL